MELVLFWFVKRLSRIQERGSDDMEKVLAEHTKHHTDESIRDRVGKGKEWNTIDDLIDTLEQCLRDCGEHSGYFGGPIRLEIEYVKELKNKHDRETTLKNNADLADFLVKNYPERITEGTEVEVAIKILKDQRAEIVKLENQKQRQVVENFNAGHRQGVYEEKMKSLAHGAGKATEKEIEDAWKAAEKAYKELDEALNKLHDRFGKKP